MGKKKFLDKKKAATFVLMHRETEDADDDVSARVFTRVDGGFTHVPGFSEEDPRTNPDYGRVTDDEEEEEEEQEEEDEKGGVSFEKSSVFADAEEDDDDDDVRSRRSQRSVASRSSCRSTASRAAHKGPLPEHVRLELIELGFPDDGYDYTQHMRKIDVSGVRGAFVPASRPKPEKLQADVKVFDASKVAVQPVEETNEVDDKIIIKNVGSSSHRVKRPAYVEHGLDPEVAAALDNSEGSEFGSECELEDDFVVFANNPEGSTSGEFQGTYSVVMSNLRLGSSVLEEDEDEGEFFEEDEGARSGVTTENDRSRPSRFLDEQFEKLALREYDDDDDEFDEEDPDARGHADISQFDDVLSEFLSDPKVFGNKYMTPAELERGSGASVSKPVENGRSSRSTGVSKEGDSAAAKSVGSGTTDSTVEARSQIKEVGGEAGSAESEDEELVVVEVESEDERSNWDCETVVSTLSNLDNHPGKISAPEKPRRKAPSLTKVLEDKEVSGGIIKLRGKQNLPTDFLPLRPGAEKAKQLKSMKKAFVAKANTISRAGETPEERKARKAAVKEERRGARAAKKTLKILYKDESQRAQHGAANTGPSGIHLP